jgi:putative membrane protein
MLYEVLVPGVVAMGLDLLNTPKAKECPRKAKRARLLQSLLAEPGRCPGHDYTEEYMNHSLSRFAIATTVAACTVLGACQKKGDVAVSDTTVAPASTDTTASAGSVASPKNDWTDAQILAFAKTANSGEIAEAKLAQHKATNPAVKKFAALMIADHTKMLADGTALATKLAITPDTSKDAVTDLAKDGDKDLKDLQDKKAGKDFDEDYMEKQVDTHQKVLDKLNDASQSAKAPEVKSAVEESIAKVQGHLTQAKAIKDNSLKS